MVESTIYVEPILFRIVFFMYYGCICMCVYWHHPPDLSSALYAPLRPSTSCLIWLAFNILFGTVSSYISEGREREGGWREREGTRERRIQIVNFYWTIWLFHVLCVNIHAFTQNTSSAVPILLNAKPGSKLYQEMESNSRPSTRRTDADQVLSCRICWGIFFE